MICIVAQAFSNQVISPTVPSATDCRLYSDLGSAVMAVANACCSRMLAAERQEATLLCLLLCPSNSTQVRMQAVQHALRWLLPMLAAAECLLQKGGRPLCSVCCARCAGVWNSLQRIDPNPCPSLARPVDPVTFSAYADRFYNNRTTGSDCKLREYCKYGPPVFREIISRSP